MDKIDKTIEALNKTYGNVINKMDENRIIPIDRISTGSIRLDEALGGGIGKGAIVEIFGMESTGKSTLSLHIISEAQKQGPVAFIDMEHALDMGYAKKLGVDISNFILSQPDYAEQAFEIMEALVETGEFSLIVLDSVAALPPKAEIDGDAGDVYMGLIARLMAQHLRKLSPVARKTKTIVIYINQIRMKIGTFGYQNPETTPGGMSLKFYSDIRMDIRRRAMVKEGDEKIGIRAKVKVVKNKTFLPFKEAEFEISYGKGINKLLEIVEIGIEKDVLTKSGTWISYGDEKIGQGLKNACHFLEANSNMLETIIKKIGKDRSKGE